MEAGCCIGLGEDSLVEGELRSRTEVGHHSLAGELTRGRKCR